MSPKEYIEQRQKSQKISTTVHRPDEGQRGALQQPGALRPGWWWVQLDCYDTTIVPLFSTHSTQNWLYLCLRVINIEISTTRFSKEGDWYVRDYRKGKSPLLNRFLPVLLTLSSHCASVSNLALSYSILTHCLLFPACPWPSPTIINSKMAKANWEWPMRSRLP